jgi:thiol-disulfide isomerase/thioredoxin
MKSNLRGAALGAGFLLFTGAPAMASEKADHTVKLDKSGEAKMGSIAPSFGLWGLEGDGPFTLDKLRKEPQPSPLLITFGASWCPPCREGLPRLKALADKHPEVRLVLVNLDQTTTAARAWLAEVGFKGPVLHDKFEVCAKLYGAAGEQKTSLPKTVLVDVKGRVRAIYSMEGPDFEKLIEADLKAAIEAPGVQAAQP